MLNKMLENIISCLRALAGIALFTGYFFSTQGHYVDVWIKTPNIGSIGNGNQKIVDFVKVIQNYGYDTLNNEYFNFSVKAAASATLYFFPTKVIFPENDYYMLIIGRIGYSAIHLLYRQNRSATPELRKSISISGLLNKSEYRPFWMNIGNNIFALGRGMVQNVNILLEWEDSSFSIKSVAILAPYYNKGFWILTVKANFTGHYSACQERNIRADMVLITSMNSINKFHCTGECSRMKDCLGFNYHDVDQTCELIRTEQFIIVQREVDGWMFYRKCLQLTEGCLCD